MRRLRISDVLFDPLTDDESRNAAKARMFSVEGDVDPVFDLNVTLFGKVGMVVCWYFDGNIEGATDFRVAASLVRAIPDLLAGRFRRLTTDQLFWLYDALGSFPRRDEDLERVYQVVHRKWSARRKSKP